MTAMIEMAGVTRSFGTKAVLRGIDLTISRGESMVIIGGSGTGKSVLLKCILGLLRPDAGTIRVDGQDATAGDRDAFLARFGMLFQGAALFDSMTVWQNVAFRLLRGRLKRPKAAARAVAVEKLRRVGLGPEVADLYPAELSGGMQKRVGLARAIAAEPEIIFFDEPTTGLDPIMAGVINELIREIVVEMGATAMTITHDMSSVRAIADQVAMLHDGKIRWTGPPGRLIAEALATLLWCYAGVLLIVWIRRTAEMGERFHVGMTALLFGSLVPVIGVFLLLLIGAAVLGLPWLARAAPLLLPAGLALSLQTELADVETPHEAAHLGRLLIAAFAAMALIGAAAWW